LGHRDFRLLWLAQVAGDLGDAIGRIALAILVFDETGSSFYAAAVFAVTVAPFFGVGQALTSWAERFPRRSVLVTADVVRALCFAAIAMPVPIGARFILLLVASLADPPFLAVRRALAPTTVPDERFPDAVTLTTVTTEAAILVGAGLGGVLVALLSAPGALALDAATFALSALFLSGVRAGRDPSASTTRAWTQLQLGWRALLADAGVFRLLWLFPLVSAGALGTEALIAPLVTGQLGLADGYVGLLAAAISVAVLATTALLPRRSRHAALLRQTARVAAVGGVIGTVGFASTATLLAAAVGYLGIGVVFACRVPTTVVMTQRLADDVRASALSVLDGAYAAAQVVAALGAGALAEAASPQTACAAFAAVAAAGGLAAVAVPVRRRMSG
jgi:predicted MFS family arabinose efflux permease